MKKNKKKERKRRRRRKEEGEEGKRREKEEMGSREMDVEGEERRVRGGRGRGWKRRREMRVTRIEK